jgi:hypothetical protein
MESNRRDRVDHHVEEEEGEMFVKARKCDVDTSRLGVELAARKDELKSELGIEDHAPEVAPKRLGKRREEGSAGRSPEPLNRTWVLTGNACDPPSNHQGGWRRPR